MNRDFDRILDDCIDRMNSGDSAEECLKFYPEFALELEPLLKAADEFRGQTTLVPSATATIKGKERLHQEMAQSEQKRSKPGLPLLERLLAKPRIWAPVAAALVLAIMAYGLWAMLISGPTPVVYAGILEIRVTDAPKYDISAVHVTIGNIEVHRDGGIEGESTIPIRNGDSGWLTVISENKSFELLELRGVEQVLGSKDLEAGHYTQIRMAVREVTVTIDGKSQSAVLPSGKLKLVGSFDIEEGKTTALTLDFDAAKSVVITGEGKIIFKPVVKLLVVKVGKK